MRKKDNAGTVRKGQPRRLRHHLKIGDRVRILDISTDLKDPEYDRKHGTKDNKFRTAELFRFCVGRIFTVYGFGRYGHVELHVSNSSVVRKKFGESHWIWCEPEFLKVVVKGGSKKSKTVSGRKP